MLHQAGLQQYKIIHFMRLSKLSILLCMKLHSTLQNHFLILAYTITHLRENGLIRAMVMVMRVHILPLYHPANEMQLESHAMIMAEVSWH